MLQINTDAFTLYQTPSKQKSCVLEVIWVIPLDSNFDAPIKGYRRVNINISEK